MRNNENITTKEIISTILLAAALGALAALSVGALTGCESSTPVPLEECRSTCSSFHHCGVCAGDTEPTCLPDRPLCNASVKTGLPAQDVLTYGCGPTYCEASLDVAGTLPALFVAENDEVGAWGVMVYDFSSVSSGVPLPLHGSSVFKVAHVRPDKAECISLADLSSSPTQPPEVGTLSISWYDLKVGEEIIVKYDGWLTCDDGATWVKSFATARFSISKTQAQ
jgi:hypothetical protein